MRVGNSFNPSWSIFLDVIEKDLAVNHEMSFFEIKLKIIIELIQESLRKALDYDFYALESIQTHLMSLISHWRDKKNKKNDDK